MKYCVYCGKRFWIWTKTYKDHHLKCWNKHEYETDKPIRLIFI